eukprot:TRINITY_DN7534_c0_g1_i2.p2 TRINITY_DN7534_c0_g1~~TRINITY_DN7534_c0_g1_i2.p2  ORF type:complete len:245 (-),score=-29.84 TRINITY_DN7534_c0_g1_i2:385-1119(-)
MVQCSDIWYNVRTFVLFTMRLFHPYTIHALQSFKYEIVVTCNIPNNHSYIQDVYNSHIKNRFPSRRYKRSISFQTIQKITRQLQLVYKNQFLPNDIKAYNNTTRKQYTQQSIQSQLYTRCLQFAYKKSISFQTIQKITICTDPNIAYPIIVQWQLNTSHFLTPCHYSIQLCLIIVIKYKSFTTCAYIMFSYPISSQLTIMQNTKKNTLQSYKYIYIRVIYNLCVKSKKQIIEVLKYIHTSFGIP